jgi:hypothetical protein
VASGFAVAGLLHWLYTLPGTVPFENFAYTFYGLAEGGKPWAVAVLKPVSSGLHPDVAMEQAVAMIRANPFPLLLGMWGFVVRFVEDQLLYVVGYAWECCSVYMYNQWYRAAFVVFEAIGLLFALRPGRTRIEGLCLVTLVGCLMSSAFTFWNADAYRTFASTNALEALLVGLGVWAVYRTCGIYPKGGQNFRSSSKAVIFISATIVALSLFAPLAATIIRVHSGSHSMSVLWCARGLTPFMIDLGRSSPFLRITPPGEQTFIPNVAEDRFLQDKTFGSIGIAKTLTTLHSGDLLVFGHDLGGLNGGTDASVDYVPSSLISCPIWLIMPGAAGLATPARYRVCASRDDIPTELGLQPVFTARKVEPAE